MWWCVCYHRLEYAQNVRFEGAELCESAQNYSTTTSTSSDVSNDCFFHVDDDGLPELPGWRCPGVDRFSADSQPVNYELRFISKVDSYFDTKITETSTMAFSTNTTSYISRHTWLSEGTMSLHQITKYERYNS